MNGNHAIEVRRRERFEFGRNWRKFLSLVDRKRVDRAKASLSRMLGLTSLAGKTFVDVGSGSGLFSLAASELGAQVVSFDFDPESVACTSELKRRYRPSDESWNIQEGSVLSQPFLHRLGKFDIVYSWGVLHHTGAMWEAIGNVSDLVTDGGLLFIAIYNDQGASTLMWRRIKALYNRLPSACRWVVLVPAFIRLWGPTLMRDLVKGRPLATWRRRESRGMAPWSDLVDWVGGYPFEVAKPEEVLAFLRARGFNLHTLTTCAGGHGCNEYVFKKEGL